MPTWCPVLPELCGTERALHEVWAPYAREAAERPAVFPPSGLPRAVRPVRGQLMPRDTLTQRRAAGRRKLREHAGPYDVTIQSQGAATVLWAADGKLLFKGAMDDCATFLAGWIGRAAFDERRQDQMARTRKWWD